MPVLRARALHIIASAAALAAVALATAACTTTGSEDITGSISAPPGAQSDAEWRRDLAMWGDRYKRNPNDADAAIGYARALRATEQRAQAVAVLEQATIRNPNSMPLLGAYGRALADAGRYQQALDALGKAHTPDNPDWRILNAQGAVLDQMGRHSEAQNALQRGAEDRAERTIGPVQPCAVLCPQEGSQERGNDAAACRVAVEGKPEGP